MREGASNLMPADCIFCRIVRGELPSQKVWENDEILAFRDIHPAAPVHVLVVPKEHIAGMAAAGNEHAALLGELLLAGQKVAEQEGLDEGYRLVINQGNHGRQTVAHLHLHVLGGRLLGAMG
ncbi:MAG: histidine triad nucleotide-binding protein [Bacillota bacterium]|nr:histidine triad nucleotide-binding protein [Bacillota bacterium]